MAFGRRESLADVESRYSASEMRVSRGTLIKSAVIGALLVVVFLLTMTLTESTPPSRITLAGGQIDSSYDRASRDLAALVAAHHGPEVEILNTAGSVENLRRITAGEVDAALLQTGIATELAPTIDSSELRAVARLYTEPLWVFYRGERELTQLTQFKPEDGKRKRIYIGFEGSGTQLVSTELLRANGVDARNADLVLLETKEMFEQLASGQLDAAFIITAPDSKAVGTLLRIPGVRPMSFPNHRAYTQRFPYLVSVELDQGTISFEDNLPAQPLHLLAPSAMLIVRDDTHPRVVEKLTKAAVKRFSRSNLIDSAGAFPSAVGLELPQHRAAEHYMTTGETWGSRNLPFWLLSLLNTLKLALIPLLAVLVPALRITPIVLGWRTMRQVRRKYAALRTIEHGMLQTTDRAVLEGKLAEIDTLVAEVTELARKLNPRYQHAIYDFRLHAGLVRQDGLDRLAKLAA